MLFQRQQCFQTWVNFFTFYQFNILGSFFMLLRHTSIRPDTPEPLIDCFLFWWTAVASMYCFLFNVIINAVVAETPKLCPQSNGFYIWEWSAANNILSLHLKTYKTTTKFFFGHLSILVSLTDPSCAHVIDHLPHSPVELPKCPPLNALSHVGDFSFSLNM